MRDKRFIAVHRGGPLDRGRHYLLATWAADCAEHVLPLFEKNSHDDAPRNAIKVGRIWAKDEIRVGDAQNASIAAHTAARNTKEPAAIAAARSAGHAVATAHFADHSLGAAYYALQAIEATSKPIHDEYKWQIERLPDPVRRLVISAFEHRYPKLWGRLTADSQMSINIKQDAVADSTFHNQPK
ncbi:putative immunity protein [Vacuolonema iberomarrocanum]|uniref:putative immunity protein n=1 Tax=Vacuolonema iberomarrocanum TaxID=3454632 RepID=UPI003F6E2E83